MLIKILVYLKYNDTISKKYKIIPCAIKKKVLCCIKTVISIVSGLKPEALKFISLNFDHEKMIPSLSRSM